MLGEYNHNRQAFLERCKAVKGIASLWVLKKKLKKGYNT
jgi:hypothetical protein